MTANNNNYLLYSIVILFLNLNLTRCQLLSENSSEITIDMDRVLYEYPCIGVKKVLMSFMPSELLVYNVTIISSEFENFPERVKLKIKFDALADITNKFNAMSFYSDSYSVESISVDPKKQNLTVSVHPLYVGGPIPNVIGVNVNGKELCDQGTKKGVWDEYARILSKINVITTEEPDTSDSPKQNSPYFNHGDEFMCGRRTIQHEGLIVKGVTSKPGDWPWHTTLYRLNTDYYQPEYICGGTLLSRTKVVTAGHCVIENGAVVLAQRMLASFGKNNLYGDDVGLQEKSVFQILVHWQFQRANLTNDLAILILTTEVTFTDYVQPACLWNTEVLQRENIFGEVGYVLGWGTTEDSKHSKKLRHTTMLVQTDIQCIRVNPTFYSRFLSETTFCAGFGNGTSVCNGDSGGGMFFPKTGADGEETWFLRGIVSLGVAKRDETICNPDLFTIFTDVAQYVDAIESVV